MRFWRSASSTSDAVILELVEIQIPEKASRTVFEIPVARLSHCFGERIDGSPISCLVLRWNSDGCCSSVALLSGLSGKVIIYNVVSGTADILAAHPLGRAKPMKQSNRRRFLHMRYWATHKNLCFRDILRKEAQSHPPIYVPEDQLNYLQTVEGQLFQMPASDYDSSNHHLSGSMDKG